MTLSPSVVLVNIVKDFVLVAQLLKTTHTESLTGFVGLLMTRGAVQRLAMHEGVSSSF